MSSLSHAAARDIVTEAWQKVWGRAPTDNEVTYAQAIAFLETGYGRTGQFGQWADQGKYNWGALERKPDASGNCPAGTESGNDQGSVCFYVYPSDVDAAARFIQILTKGHWPVVQAMQGSPEDVATAMRSPPPYYNGTAATEDAKITQYANAIRNAISQMGVAVPSGPGTPVSVGPSLTKIVAVGAIAALLGYAYYQTYGTPKFLKQFGIPA